MKTGIVQQKWKTIAGWFLQLYVVIHFLFLFCLLFTVPVLDANEIAPPLSEYELLVSRINPYVALILVGTFCLGRWLTTQNKQKATQSSELTGYARRSF